MIKLRSKFKYVFIKYKTEIYFTLINFMTYGFNLLFIKIILHESVWLATMLNVLIIWFSACPLLFISVPRLYRKYIQWGCLWLWCWCCFLNYGLYLFRNQIFRIYCDINVTNCEQLKQFIKFSSVIILYGPMKDNIYRYCKTDKAFAAYFDPRINTDEFLAKIGKNSLENVSGIIYRYICTVDELNPLPNNFSHYNIIILSTLYL